MGEVANTRMPKHPTVMQLSDASYACGTFFPTLDYCDAGSVAGLIQQRTGRRAKSAVGRFYPVTVPRRPDPSALV
jgi:hypothetical protein